MIRKSDYIEQIDKYLNEELEQPELSLFEIQVDSDSDLAEDINLLKEIDGAIAESELIALRKNINAILNIEQNCGDYLTPEPYLFVS